MKLKNRYIFPRLVHSIVALLYHAIKGTPEASPKAKLLDG
jgi:hypothetical protein